MLLAHGVGAYSMEMLSHMRPEHGQKLAKTNFCYFLVEKLGF